MDQVYEYECPMCDGTGEEWYQDSPGVWVKEDCPDCNGTGLVEHDPSSNE